MRSRSGEYIRIRLADFVSGTGVPGVGLVLAVLASLFYVGLGTARMGLNWDRSAMAGQCNRADVSAAWQAG